MSTNFNPNFNPIINQNNSKKNEEKKKKEQEEKNEIYQNQPDFNIDEYNEFMKGLEDVKKVNILSYDSNFHSRKEKTDREEKKNINNISIPEIPKIETIPLNQNQGENLDFDIDEYIKKYGSNDLNIDIEGLNREFKELKIDSNNQGILKKTRKKKKSRRKKKYNPKINIFVEKNNKDFSKNNKKLEKKKEIKERRKYHGRRYRRRYYRKEYKKR
ncbi:hypothetical protein ACFL2K_01815, partial [Candidatus Margulisiibacteriota bacterium]